MLLVAAVFLLPLIAAWLYYAYGTHPEPVTNHGELVSGVTLPDPLGPLPLAGKWTLLVAESSDCDADCDARLYRMRQVWLSLGRKAERVRRAVISDGGVLLDGERSSVHPDLVELPVDSLSDEALQALDTFPHDTELVVIDPLGNVVLRYREGYEMADLKADLVRLLRLSRIG
jgi:cytochrome oxidase Cu insertion factor (SCO1/SenC/PrrC family)